MERNDLKNRSTEYVILAAMTVFFIALMVVGTFYDEAIDAKLFMPKNVPVTLITTLGMYPFAAAIVLFLGVLFERVVHGKTKKGAKIVLGALIVLFAIFVGFIGSGSIVDRDCLGSIFPSLNRNIPVILIISPIIEYPLFFLGYKLAGKTVDERLGRKALVTVLILCAAFTINRTLKGIVCRPRYRSVVLGYEEVGFVPWYSPFKGAEEMMVKYSLDKGEFRSFPSGHGILSMSVIIILISLTWLLPKLKEKRIALIIGGFIFSVVIMFTRLVLGAHYLTDVCVGAIVALILTFIHYLIIGFIEKSKSQKIPDTK